MQITVEKLKEILLLAFDRGYNYPSELKNECVEEILSEIPCDDFRIYSSEELEKLTEGTTFQHSTHGRCWIVLKGSKKIMHFQVGALNVPLTSNTKLWNSPMKMLFKGSPLPSPNVVSEKTKTWLKNLL